METFKYWTEYKTHGDSPVFEQFNWCLTGPDGGIHIWARVNPSRVISWEKYYGGVETHYRKQVYSWQEEPSHAHCWLLDGPCWHDGTSLYFSERLAPMLNNYEPEELTKVDFEGELRWWYSQQFEKREDD